MLLHYTLDGRMQPVLSFKLQHAQFHTQLSVAGRQLGHPVIVHNQVWYWVNSIVGINSRSEQIQQGIPLVRFGIHQKQLRAARRDNHPIGVCLRPQVEEQGLHGFDVREPGCLVAVWIVQYQDVWA